MANYKIVVPKVGAINELGTESKLYVLDEMVDAKEEWQQSLMDVFVSNKWAVETKMDAATDLETTEPVRARTEKGHFIADDESTPDINEAYVGGVAPKETTQKRTTKKKTKKKAS
jgi:hypothetical protein|tara:strand:+ start:370 stop:714 length:345 start_codon:yes stop_codon:yes gene_type:complete